MVSVKLKFMAWVFTPVKSAIKQTYSFKLLNIDDFLKGSAYYDGDKEGFVLKNYGRCNVWGRQMFAKVVAERFKESNHAKFGTLIKRDTSDTQKLFDETVTDARIEKKVIC